MPIYEFYCRKCHMIFNFFSGTVNTEKRPKCPKCEKVKLERQMSMFSTLRNRGEEEDTPLPDMDESKMAQAMNLLEKEAAHIDENDPKQAANLMRKLTDMTGLDLGSGMEDLWQVSIIPNADFNGDGKVDLKDLIILIFQRGTNSDICDIGPMPWGDGKVDKEDLKVLMRYLKKENMTEELE